MKTKRALYLLVIAAGIGLLLAALFIFNTNQTRMFSGICYGLSAAAFGLGTGWFIRSFTVSELEDAQIQKQKEIDVRDERNTRIREKTGYMVAKFMNYVLCAFILILGFMGAPPAILLMAAALIVIEFGLLIYFSNHYAKTM